MATRGSRHPAPFDGTAKRAAGIGASVAIGAFVPSEVRLEEHGDEKAFDPDQPRDEHGRWTGIAGAIARAARAGGGTLERSGKLITSGKVVAFGGHSSITPDADWSEHGKERTKQWLRDNADLFDQPGVKVGVWHDTDHNEIVLDPVEVLADLEEAKRRGVQRDQIKIYDLDSGEEIPTGGTGGREEKATGGDRAAEAHLRDDGGGARRIRRPGGEGDSRGEGPPSSPGLKSRWEGQLHPRDRLGRFSDSGIHSVPPVPGPSTGIRLDASPDAPFEGSDTLVHQQFGDTPGEGHFGTGVYFVSKPERARLTSGGERHLRGVDLAGANLWKPKDEREAFAVHDTLRDADSLAAAHELAMAVNPLGFSSTARVIDPKSIAKKLQEAGLEATPKMVQDAIYETIMDLQAGTDERLNHDTAGTRIMRALGYDGVDVRHLDERLDNTMFGSVIYRRQTKAGRWSEGEHPRDWHGEFAHKPGSGGRVPSKLAGGYAQAAQMLADKYAQKAQDEQDKGLAKLPDWLASARDGDSLDAGTVVLDVRMWDTGKLRVTVNSRFLEYPDNMATGAYVDDPDAVEALTRSTQELTDRFKATTLATQRKQLRGSVAADTGVDGKRAYRAVRDALAENEGLPKFTALRDRFPEVTDDLVLISEKGYGRTSLGINDVFVTAARTREDVTGVNALAMAVQQRLADDDPNFLAGRFGPHSVKPGDSFTATRSPAGTLRHEWAHGLWSDLSDEQRSQFTSMLPQRTMLGQTVTDWDEIAKGLSQYAAGDIETRSRYLKANGETGGYLTETFAEATSLVTGPYYKPDEWPHWVQRLGWWINQLEPA